MPREVRKLNYIPEIMYDSPAYAGQKVSPIPFVVIPQDKDMPVGLFILEYRKTGEIQVGDGGLPEEIEEGPFPHTYIEMDYLMEVLTEQFPTLDMDSARKQIRVALGMKSTKQESAEAGAAILDRVQEKELQLEEKARAEQDERMKKIAKLISEAKKEVN